MDLLYNRDMKSITQMHYRHECLYDVEWQALRVSLLKEHRTDGGWTTIEGTANNLNALAEYRLQHNFETRDEACWRSINLMNAVLLGWRNEYSEIAKDLIIVDRTYVQMRLGDGLWWKGRTWDWDQVSKDLQSLDEKTFFRIKDNLDGRVKTSIRRNGHTKFRPELMKFLELVKECNK